MGCLFYTRFVTVTYNACLYIFGGYNANMNRHFNDLWKYDPGKEYFVLSISVESFNVVKLLSMIIFLVLINVLFKRLIMNMYVVCKKDLIEIIINFFIDKTSHAVFLKINC